MKRYVFAASVAVLMSVCDAGAQQTRLLTADKASEYGIAYSLPATALQIDVEGEVTRSVPGPYYQYAKRYLGQTNVVTEERVQTSVTGVGVQPYGVSTPRRYVMQLKPGALTKVCVDADGMLLAINTEAAVQERAAAADPVVTEAPDMDEYLKYVDADFLASISSARRAEMLAQTIMEIRESRLSLSRGTAETMPVDGRQLELMLQSLEQQEQALVRAFTGFSHTVPFRRSFSVTPDSLAQGQTMTLCRISNEAGVVEPDSYAGEALTLRIGYADAPATAETDAAPKKEMPKDGVVYALPASAEVSIAFRGKTLYEDTLEFAQFGTQFALDPKLFTDRKAPSCATFDPVTGALLTIETIK